MPLISPIIVPQPEQPTSSVLTPAVLTVPGLSSTLGDTVTTGVLQFISGDKRNPTSRLSMHQLSGSVRLLDGGFTPEPSEESILWFGPSLRYNGRRRVTSSRDYTVLKLEYAIYSPNSSYPEMQKAQEEILRLVNQVKTHNEDFQDLPLYLEYRFGGTGDIPQAQFGQQHYFIEVMAMKPEIETLTSFELQNYMIAKCTLTLWCDWSWTGVQEFAGIASGFVEQLPGDGILTNVASENWVNDPVFANGTWSILSGAGTISRQKIKDDDIPGDYIQVLKTGSAGDVTYRALNTTTLTTNTLTQWAIVRNDDKSAVTSADVELYNSLGSITETYVAYRNGWYLVYGTVAVTGTSSWYAGLTVKASKNVIVAGIQVYDDYSTDGIAGPIIHPAQMTIQDTTAPYQPTGGTLKYRTDVGSRMTGNFTMKFWFTPFFDEDAIGFDREIFNIDTDRLKLNMNQSTGQFDLTKYDGTTSYAVNEDLPAALSFGTPMQIVIVQTDTDLYLYANGTSLGNTTTPMFFEPAASSFLTMATNNIAMDGLQIWDIALSSAQISTLYTQEAVIKNAGDALGMPPYIWATGNTSTIPYGQVNGFNGGYGIVSSVPGQLEADTEWGITSGSGSGQYRDVYLGRKAVREPFNPLKAGIFGEMVGTTDTDASGGTAQAMTLDGNPLIDHGYFSHTFTDTTAPQAMRGRYTVLFGLDTIAAPEMQFFYVYRHFDTDYGTFYYTKSILYSTFVLSDYELYDLKTINLRHGADDDLFTPWTTPDVFTIGVRLLDASNHTGAKGDFIMLMPHPFCKIKEYTSGAGIKMQGDDDLIIRSDKTARFIRGNREVSRVSYIGSPVTVQPDRLNYFFITGSLASRSYDPDALFDVWLKVTPRYVLGGG